MFRVGFRWDPHLGSCWHISSLGPSWCISPTLRNSRNTHPVRPRIQKSWLCFHDCLGHTTCYVTMELGLGGVRHFPKNSAYMRKEFSMWTWKVAVVSLPSCQLFLFTWPVTRHVTADSTACLDPSRTKRLGVILTSQFSLLTVFSRQFWKFHQILKIPVFCVERKYLQGTIAVRQYSTKLLVEPYYTKELLWPATLAHFKLNCAMISTSGL